MNKPPDLTWTQLGAFTMFMPETPAGREAWTALAAESDGTGKFLNHQAPAIKKQLRAAGYTVRKNNPAPVSIDRITELLDKHDQ